MALWLKETSAKWRYILQLKYNIAKSLIINEKKRLDVDDTESFSTECWNHEKLRMQISTIRDCLLFILAQRNWELIMRWSGCAVTADDNSTYMGSNAMICSCPPRGAQQVCRLLRPVKDRSIASHRYPIKPPRTPLKRRFFSFSIHLSKIKSNKLLALFPGPQRAHLSLRSE